MGARPVLGSGAIVSRLGEVQDCPMGRATLKCLCHPKMLSLPRWSGVDSPGAEVPCAPSLFPSPPTRREFGEEGAQACLPFDFQPISRLTAAARAVHGSCLGKEACHQSSQLRGCHLSASYAL